jgi:hypothetical protein
MNVVLIEKLKEVSSLKKDIEWNMQSSVVLIPMLIFFVPLLCIGWIFQIEEDKQAIIYGIYAFCLGILFSTNGISLLYAFLILAGGRLLMFGIEYLFDINERRWVSNTSSKIDCMLNKKS